MNRVVLDGSRWATREDFYQAILAALGAPSWHGHNLDALNDSIGGGDINTLNPPVEITIVGTEFMAEPAATVVDGFRLLVEDLQKQGVEIIIETTLGAA